MLWPYAHPVVALSKEEYDLFVEKGECYTQGWRLIKVLDHDEKPKLLATRTVPWTNRGDCVEVIRDWYKGEAE